MLRYYDVFLIVFLLVLPGCGQEDWGSATGTVTLAGQRMARGTVVFHPLAGGALASARILPEGTFKLSTGAREGLKPGDYKVTVTDVELPPEGKGQSMQFLTPLRYASPATTDLAATVKPGVNTFAFDLKK